MIKIFLALSMLMFSFFMLFMTHPLSMGMMILLQTLLTCLLTGMITKTYWFSYILFLTFLGGLLVLFIYVSSISSNELFYFKMNFKIIIFFIMNLIFIITLYYMNNVKWLNLFFNEDMNNFSIFSLFFNDENKMNLIKLYNTQTFMMMMMMIIYLFIALIAMVKITNIFYGPLRSSN